MDEDGVLELCDALKGMTAAFCRIASALETLAEIERKSHRTIKEIRDEGGNTQ